MDDQHVLRHSQVLRWAEMLEQCGCSHCHQVSNLQEDQEHKAKLDADINGGVSEIKDITKGHGEHQNAVDLVNDGHPCVEVVQQCCVTRAVPLHLDEVHRVAHQVDQQQDDGEKDDVDVEKPVPIRHSVEVSTYSQNSQYSACQLDDEEINPILVFHYQC